MTFRRAVPIALFLAFLLGGAGLARALAARAWSGFVGYHTPFVFAPADRPAAGAPLVESAVVVLLDGLTVRGSRGLAFLDELRARGADLECRAGEPSLSLPGRGVILSGAWSDVHGQTTNFKPRPLPVEHLFSVARAHGRRTALAAGPLPHRLVDGHLSAPLVFHESESGARPTLASLDAATEARVQAAGRLLREARPHLAVLELTLTDEAGHAWGAASPEYAQAAARADEALRRLASGIDLERSLLLVTSDHGHTPRGGHGGGEEEVLAVPVVMAGGPVRAASRGSCRQVDLAPTLAVLLGLPIPASSQGRPLLDHLALDPAAAAAIRRDHASQRARFADHYAARLEVAAGTPGAPGDPDGGLARAEAQQDEARRLRGERDRRDRLPAAAMLVLALPALLLLARGLGVGGGEIAWALLGAAGGLALYHALFPLLGLGYSFSLVNRDEDLGAFFRKDMLLAVGSVAAALAVAAALRHRRAGLGVADLVRLSVLLAAAFAGLLWMRIGVLYGLQGVFAKWQLPDVAWAFAFYLDVLAAMAVGFAAPLLPGVAVLAAYATGRPNGARMVP